MTKKELEQYKRDKIKREKPLVYAKMLQINEREKRGELTCRMDVGYRYACNLHCQHCMADRFQHKERSLNISDMRSIAEQANALGWCQFNISGGEPLILKDFDEVLKACMPDRFHIGISTNGYFLTPDRAKQLKTLGLDKVMISFDSINPDLHNQNREDKEAFEKAMSAVWAAKGAELDVVLQHVVTHQNAQTENTVEIAKFCQDNGFSLDIVLGKAIGVWEGKHEILITEDDAAFLRKLHKQYPVARRDIYPAYGRGGGCGTFRRCFHISQWGDVFVCVFIHISLGNVFEESLKDIMERAKRIKPLQEISPICRAGEDRLFIAKYMTKFYNKPKPVHYTEIFNKEDYI